MRNSAISADSGYESAIPLELSGIASWIPNVEHTVSESTENAKSNYESTMPVEPYNWYTRVDVAPKQDFALFEQLRHAKTHPDSVKRLSSFSDCPATTVGSNDTEKFETVATNNSSNLLPSFRHEDPFGLSDSSTYDPTRVNNGSVSDKHKPHDTVAGKIANDSICQSGLIGDTVSTLGQGSKDTHGLSKGYDLFSMPSIGKSVVNQEKTRLGSPARAKLKNTDRSKEREPAHKGNDVQASDDSAWSLSPDESSARSESETGYDSNTSETSIFSSSRKDLISRLMDEICTLFFSQASCSPRRHGEGTHSATDTQTGNPSTSVGTSDQSNSAPSQNPWKRTQRDDKDPDEADDQPNRRRTQDPNQFDNQPVKRRNFACPFHKYDAPTYSNGNEDSRLALKYRSCGPPGWPTIGKMK